MDIAETTTFPEGDHRNRMPLFKPEARRIVLAMVGELRTFADRIGCSVPAFALKWVISQKGIRAALVGIGSPEQAIENFGANNSSLLRILVALEKSAAFGGSSAAVADNTPAVERKLRQRRLFQQADCSNT